MDDIDASVGSFSRGKRLLPGWMVHNIERLHTCTDFEQYASSPPETEGFIPEHASDAEVICSDASSHAAHMDRNEPPVKMDQEPSAVSSGLLADKMSPPTSCSLLPKHHSMVDALKSEEILYSSPDVTPCVTPDASPMPQRKISLKLQNTVQANPKKWFYIESAMGQKYKEMRGKADGSTIQNAINVKGIKDVQENKKSKKTCTNNTIKLAISNFDINAISPSSW